MVNVGMVGLGKMGRLHMMNCFHIEGVKVVAAADQSKGALNKAKSLGVEHVYADYKDLLRSSHGLDAVIISLPNFLHFDSIQWALENGLNVFVEKPLATTAEQCRQIVRLVEKNNAKLMIGHVMRFFDCIEKMKKITDVGAIGDLEVITLEEVINGPFSHGVVPAPVADWWFDPKKSGGGVLIDLGYHLIDLFRFFVGECQLLYTCFDHKFNLPVEDGAIAILRSTNPLTKGIINVGWYQKTVFPQYNFRTILHGNAGYLSSDDLVPRNVYAYAVKEGTKNFLRRIAGRGIKPLAYSYYYKTYFKELTNFFDCIKQDSEPSVTAIDGLRTVEIIEEAYSGLKKIS